MKESKNPGNFFFKNGKTYYAWDGGEGPYQRGPHAFFESLEKIEISISIIF